MLRLTPNWSLQIKIATSFKTIPKKNKVAQTNINYCKQNSDPSQVLLREFNILGDFEPLPITSYLCQNPLLQF